MTHHQFSATAIILAGGKSSRLGFDKQLLQFNGNPLIDMLLALLTPLFKEVILVSNTPELHQHRSCRVVSDILTECGPLGGLHAGLSAASYRMCYVTACDMPWISVPYIRFLMECHRGRPDTEAVVTRLGDMLEPMNALYSKALIPLIETVLGEHRRKMTAILDCASTYYVPEDVARRYSPDWAMFDNINTPADWDRCRNQEGGEHHGDQKNPHHAART